MRKRYAESWLLRWFLDREDLIHADILQHLSSAAGPQNFDLLNRARGTHAGVQSDVVAAQVTGDVIDFPDLQSLRCLNPDRCAKTKGVALLSLRPNDDPVGWPHALIFQQDRPLSQARNRDIEISVVV